MQVADGIVLAARSSEGPQQAHVFLRAQNVFVVHTQERKRLSLCQHKAMCRVILQAILLCSLHVE